MHNRLSSGALTKQLAVVLSFTAALLGEASPGFATTISLPSEERAAVVGAFDVANADSTTSRKQGASDNSAPTGASGFLGTAARGGPGASQATARQDDPFAVVADGQLVEAIATQGLMGPGALEPAGLEALAATPGAYTTSAGMGKVAGRLTRGGPGDPEVGLVVQIPALITSLDSAVAIVDVGSGDGGGLHWNAGDSASPDTNAAFAGNLLTNTDIPVNDPPISGAAPSGAFNGGPAASSVAAVPEPASLVLLGSGLVAAGVRQWKRRTNERRAS
jgi:hypothetical protein